MGKIEVINQPNQPIVICPRCEGKNHIDISPWKDDVTRIMEDKCVKCGGTIVVGMLILADIHMARLLQTVQAVIAVIKNQNQVYTGD
jgi:hypothetical protein